MKNYSKSKKDKENYRNLNLRPFQYVKMSVQSRVVETLIMLIPYIALLVVSKTFSALIVLVACVSGALLSEAVSYYIRKKINFLSIMTSILQGSLVALLLPEKYPVFGSFIIVFCTLLLLKYAYGAFSDNWINPVCVVLAICFILGQSKFPEFSLSKDIVVQKNPSLFLIQDGFFPVSKIDMQITSFLNSTVFKIFNISIPEGYISLMWDNHCTIPAFRFNVITLFVSIVLFSSEVVSMLVPSLFVLVYAALVYISGSFFSGGTLLHGDILLAIFTSGILFSALFILQWYGTLPVSFAGKIIFAVSTGVICYFINGYGLSPIGTVFTILLSNVLSTMIQYVEDHNSSRHLRKNIIPKIHAFKAEE